jgi:hypothetical protein
LEVFFGPLAANRKHFEELQGFGRSIELALLLLFAESLSGASKG